MALYDKAKSNFINKNETSETYTYDYLLELLADKIALDDRTKASREVQNTIKGIGKGRGSNAAPATGDNPLGEIETGGKRGKRRKGKGKTDNDRKDGQEKTDPKKKGDPTKTDAEKKTAATPAKSGGMSRSQQPPATRTAPEYTWCWFDANSMRGGDPCRNGDDCPRPHENPSNAEFNKASPPQRTATPARTSDQKGRTAKVKARETVVRTLPAVVDVERVKERMIKEKAKETKALLENNNKRITKIPRQS